MTLEAWVNPSTVNGNWRDVVYKGNDNYYLEATSTNASRPDARLIAGGTLRRRVRYRQALRQYLVLSDRDLRRVDAAAVCQRDAGRVDRPHGRDIATSTNPLQIGGDSIYGQFFAGLIDNVRVYNTALTAAQIQTDQTTAVTSGRGHDAAVAAGDADDDGGLGQRGRPDVGRVDRQCRCHRLPGGALPGRGLHELCPGRRVRPAPRTRTRASARLRATATGSARPTLLAT